MASAVSPGVYAREIDQSLYVSSLADAALGAVGTANWGPVNVPTLITSHTQLFNTFGNFSGPMSTTDLRPIHPLTYAVARYLRRGRRAYVVRVASSYLLKASLPLTYTAASLSTKMLAVEGKYAGSFGNNIRIKIGTGTKDQSYFKLEIYVYSVPSKVNYLAETFDNLEPSSFSDNYLINVINSRSKYITLSQYGTRAVRETGISTDPVNPAAAIATKSSINEPNGQLIAGKTYYVAYSWHNSAGLETLASTAASVTIDSSGATPHNAISITIPALVTGATGAYIYAGETSTSLKRIGRVTAAGAYKILHLGLQLGSFTSNNYTGNFDAVTDLSTTSAQLVGGKDGGIKDGALNDADFNGVEKSSVNPTDTGISCFRDTDGIDVSILICPNISSTGVVNKLISTAELRTDAIAVVDPPYGLSVQQVVEWHNGDLESGATFGTTDGETLAVSLDSNYAATYWPWCQISDDFNGGKVWMAPSAFVAETIAYNDYIADPWYAPAGASRALLSNVLKTEYSPNQGDRDALYGGGNSINPIATFYGSGIQIFGNKTLQRRSTALDRINVRRLLIVLRKLISRSVRTLLFEPNDPTMWRQFEGLVTPLLVAVQDRRGITEFKVQMDSTTNTEDVIENNQAVGNIFIKPTKTAEIIMLNFILTNQGAEFTETIVSSSVS